MYIALGELMMLVSFAASSVYQVIHKRQLDPANCSRVGAMFAYFSAVEYMLSGLLAAMTYANVCRHWNLTPGKWDWKLIGVPNLFTAIMLCMTVKMQWFGPWGEFR